MKNVISAIAILALATVSVNATIINIPDDYPTIQQGIDHSSHGDTVLVQPDSYYENLNFNGHNVVLASLLLTTGDTSYISSTIIDGDSAGTVITFESGEDSTAQVVGFTIQNGYADFGGGIHCYSSSPTISGNTISRNSAYANGGGICCWNNSSPTISGNTISRNSAYWSAGGILCDHYSSPAISNNNISSNSALHDGGGIECDSSSPRISGNTISRNSAWNGGGISCRWSSPTISNNNISSNAAIYGGGGIECWDSTPTISGNTITGNSASHGGGIYCYESSPTISNNTISGNLADYGGGIDCTYYSYPTITNTILWEDTASNGAEIYVYSGSPTVTYCDVQGGWSGTGNIEENPLFVGPEEEDYRIRWHSPCIDAGDPNSPLDPDGTRSDMGAFYFNQDVVGIVEIYPHGAPIIIPPHGGDVVYDGLVFNFLGHPGRADIWTYAFVPGAGRYGPIDLYRNTRIPVDSIGMNSIGQHVPGAAPAGDYVFAAYIGNYPGTVIDSSYFYFTKSGSIGAGIENWAVGGAWLSEKGLTASSLPRDYSLSQNFPNPFNAKTVIDYQLPVEGRVKVEVYNTLGQKVATLADGRELAGYMSVIWDASEVSSGIYFYKLSAGDFSGSKRMMVVK